MKFLFTFLCTGLFSIHAGADQYAEKANQGNVPFKVICGDEEHINEEIQKLECIKDISRPSTVVKPQMGKLAACVTVSLSEDPRCLTD